MKKSKSLAVMLIILLFVFLTASCNQKISGTDDGSNTAPPSDTVSVTTGGDASSDPSDGRVEFEKASFYPLLGYANAVYSEKYIGKWDNDEVMKELKEYYDDGVFDNLKGDDLDLAIVNTYIQLIGDQFGAYFTESAYNDFVTESEGNYVGIGVTIIYCDNIEYKNDPSDEGSKTVNGGMMIVKIDENSLARGIVEVGDIIIRVEGDSVYDIGYDETVNYVRGEEGTFVTFSVIRGAEIVIGDDGELLFDMENARELELKVVRKGFVMQSVYGEMLEDNTAYIQILSFDRKTHEQFLDVLTALLEKGAERFVFDVRANPGGEVTSVLSVLSSILDYDPSFEKKAIFSVNDKNGKTDPEYTELSIFYMDYFDISDTDTASDGAYANAAEEYAAAAKQIRENIASFKESEREAALLLAEKYERFSRFDFQLPTGAPVVVLTDGNTASAGELFTKVLSDFGVSHTIGTKTYGKGSMQSMYYLYKTDITKGVIKVSANTYRSPYSENYHGVGIEPDERVELTSELGNLSIHLLTREEDNQLAAALEYLNNK